MKNIAKLAAALVVAGFASGVSAQTITFGTPTPATTTVGTAANAVTVDVIYDAPGGGADPVAVGADVFIPAEFTAVSSNDAGECVVGSPAAGRIRISQIDLALNPLPDSTICTLTFTVANNVPVGTYNFTLCNAASGGGCVDPESATVAFGPGFQVTAAPVVTGPSIVAGTPAFGSTTAVGGGFISGPAVTQNITFGPSTGGAAGGTTALACTDDDPNTTLTNASQPGIANGATPTAIVASFTPQAAARTVTVSCTATPQGAAVQNFTYTFNVAAGAALPPPPPEPAVIPASSLWSQLSLIALFAALGGLVLVLRRNG